MKQQHKAGQSIILILMVLFSHPLTTMSVVLKDTLDFSQSSLNNIAMTSDSGYLVFISSATNVHIYENIESAWQKSQEPLTGVMDNVYIVSMSEDHQYLIFVTDQTGIDIYNFDESQKQFIESQVLRTNKDTAEDYSSLSCYSAVIAKNNQFFVIVDGEGPSILFYVLEEE